MSQSTLFDLTQRAPRSPRVRIGGFAILARMLDKGRALLAGKIGEYKYACPLDQQFLTFTGVNADDITALLKAGKGDWEIYQWITEHASIKRRPEEILAWSSHQAKRGPAELGTQEFFLGELRKVGPQREDITTWFELIDLDDYVSFGGKA